MDEYFIDINIFIIRRHLEIVYQKKKKNEMALFTDSFFVSSFFIETKLNYISTL